MSALTLPHGILRVVVARGREVCEVLPAAFFDKGKV